MMTSPGKRATIKSPDSTPDSPPGTLYLLPNTLGTRDEQDRLEAVLPAEVMAQAARLRHFVVENAKTARAFLKCVQAHIPLTAPLQQIAMQELNVRTRPEDLHGLLQPLLQGHDTGLLSEAGVPAVADPGAALVRLAHAHGIPVKPLVGPSSLLLALMASGLDGQCFAFHGYLPTDGTERQRRIRELEDASAQRQQTQIFIETPYRNAQLLRALAEHCRPGTLICAATDLTLGSESIATLSAAQWLRVPAARTDALQKRPTVFLMLAPAPAMQPSGRRP